jgi:hypothetical protein
MDAIAETGSVLFGGTAGARSAAKSNRGVWIGRGLSTVAILFLIVDAVGKLLELPPYVAATVELGYPAEVLFALGVIETICLVAYVIPRSAALGAILLTGWLGGAVATHLRLGNPLATHTLFPIYLAAFIWGGLYLRQAWIGRIVGLGATEAR